MEISVHENRMADMNKRFGYAPVIRLKMAISDRHAHIYAGKTFFLDSQILNHVCHFEEQLMGYHI